MLPAYPKSNILETKYILHTEDENDNLIKLYALKYIEQVGGEKWLIQTGKNIFTSKPSYLNS